MHDTLHLRRCRTLYLEPRQQTSFDLRALVSGGTGMTLRSVWTALAPHLPAPVELTESQVLLLGRLDPERWEPRPAGEDDSDLRYLLAHGLVQAQGADRDALAEREAQLRQVPWWGPAAMLHWQGRWQGQDSVKALESAGLHTAAGLRAHLGPPPPALAPHAGEPRHLPRQPEEAFDRSLRERSTCRNFDTAQPLPLAELSRLLQRTLAETGRQVVEEDAVFLKKNVPSAGGLHPTEAYLLVQHVEGLQAGLYHYDPASHGVSALPSDARSMAELAALFTAGQHWFADAPVLIVLAPRFARTYWKYRHHPKAYRAVILDVGHISQLLLTCATEQGLGAFVTAAINEQDIEQVLGMDPMQLSPLAVCGVGWRAQQMSTSEFDPGGQVWTPVLTAEPPTG
ncbi:putative peptide maturation dehydrogenase [Stenotrophomonas sp. RG-453]|nr:putative peptide maturation dehydrogenase [Stenotrophomonas sp. RG-453]